MPYFPPDAREESSFEILRGMGDTIYRMDLDIRDIHDVTDALPDTVTVGTPLRFLAGHNEAYVVNDGSLHAGGVEGHVVGVYEAGMVAFKHADRFAGFAFGDYDKTSATGMPDANFRNALTVLTGEYIAKIAIGEFKTSGTYTTLVNGPDQILDYATTLEVGQDVVVVNFISAIGAAGVPKFCCLKTDFADRYTAGPTPAQIATDMAAIGRIMKLDTDYVYVRVSC
jgi:hypothetical protein